MNFKRVAGLLLGVLSSTAMAEEHPLHPRGEAVYDQLCMACHQTGVAGAPIRGDEQHWALRLEQGFESLVRHAIDGIGAMPPRGGNPNLSDDEMRAATFYLVEPAMDDMLPPGEELEDQVDEQAAPDPVGPAPTLTEPAGEEEVADHHLLDGEALYSRARCATCHATGIARAPVLGDPRAWGSRLEKGREVLYQSVIAGKGVMPPRGASTATDEELKAMVDFMIERSE
ncbi:c-type cytochrome [Vreelandella sp. EE22]